MVSVDEEENQEHRSRSPSTRAYLRKLRNEANLSIEVVAERAGVSSTWLERFEAGTDEGDISYDLILRIVRATQPPRPDWWDEGHEHDLHPPVMGDTRPRSPSRLLGQDRQGASGQSRGAPTADLGSADV